MISTDVYEINVTWDLPEIIPDFYDVTLNLYSGRGNFVAQNVSGVSIFPDEIIRISTVSVIHFFRVYQFCWFIVQKHCLFSAS